MAAMRSSSSSLATAATRRGWGASGASILGRRACAAPPTAVQQQPLSRSLIVPSRPSLAESSSSASSKQGLFSVSDGHVLIILASTHQALQRLRLRADHRPTPPHSRSFEAPSQLEQKELRHRAILLALHEASTSMKSSVTMSSLNASTSTRRSLPISTLDWLRTRNLVSS